MQQNLPNIIEKLANYIIKNIPTSFNQHTGNLYRVINGYYHIVRVLSVQGYVFG